MFGMQSETHPGASITFESDRHIDPGAQEVPGLREPASDDHGANRRARRQLPRMCRLQLHDQAAGARLTIGPSRPVEPPFLLAVLRHLHLEPLERPPGDVVLLGLFLLPPAGLTLLRADMAVRSRVFSWITKVVQHDRRGARENVESLS